MIARVYRTRYLFIVSLFSLLSQDNKSGRSPLVHAVENNLTDMVIFLLEVCVHVYIYIYICVCFFC